MGKEIEEALMIVHNDDPITGLERIKHRTSSVGCLMRFLSFVLMTFLLMRSISFGADALTQSDLTFSVIRNDKVVGEHKTKFIRKDDHLLVNSVMSLEISFLSIPIYDFYYQSDEIWRNDQLVSVDVSVDDDGEVKSFSVQQKENGLVVDEDLQSLNLSTPFFTTNHWHYGVVETSQVFNTLTGKLNQVSIINKGEEEIETTSGTILATRFEYSGDLQDTSVWYDSDGRWVKLSFLGRDKSKIEYICNSCDTELKDGS